MENLEDAKTVIAIFTALIGLILGFARWFWGRVSNRVTDGVRDVQTGQTDIARRLEKVEVQVEGLSEQDARIEGRLNDVERSIGSLASKEDLSNLAIILAEVRAMGRASSEKMDTLYRALIHRVDP